LRSALASLIPPPRLALSQWDRDLLHTRRSLLAIVTAPPRVISRERVGLAGSRSKTIAACHARMMRPMDMTRQIT
jgi:hypothetical protein